MESIILNKTIKGPFQILSFEHPHSKLVLRATVEDFNKINENTGKYEVQYTDIEFWGVQYIQLPIFLEDIIIVKCSEDEWQLVTSQLHIKTYPQFSTLYKVVANNVKYYILADDCKIKKS